MAPEFWGVTGTNGKTTVTWMLRQILMASGRKCGLVGTIRHLIGDQVYEAINTTPGSALLQRYSEELEASGVPYCMLEASSQGLEQGRLSGIRFRIAGFTNLTRDHLDYHGSMEAYYAAKRRLFLQTDGPSVIHVGDAYGRRLAKELADSGNQVYTYALAEELQEDLKADYTAEADYRGLEETVLAIRGAGTIFVPMGGRPAALDSLCAAAMALSAGIAFPHIRSGIEGMEPIPGRMQVLHSTDLVTVVVDYAHTPDGLENLLRTASAFRKRELMVVFGCGGERDRGKRSDMGRIAARFADGIILTDDNPRQESRSQIFADILQGIDSAQRCRVIPDRETAIAEAIAEAQPEDVVIVAGRGHEGLQIIGTEKVPFDDRQTAERYLKKRKGGTEK